MSKADERAMKRELSRARALRMAKFGYFKPTNSSDWFQFEKCYLRSIFFRGVTCIFCLDERVAHRHVDDFNHLKACSKSSGTFTSEEPQKFLPALDEQDRPTHRFSTICLDGILAKFQAALSIRRAERDKGLKGVEEGEFTLIERREGDPDLADATMFVDAAEQAETAFVQKALDVQPILSHFGFVRYRPRDVSFATATQEQVFPKRFKEVAYQTRHKTKNTDGALFFITDSRKNQKHRPSAEMLFREGKGKVLNENANYATRDEPFLDLLNCDQTIIKYPSNVANGSNGSVKISYHCFSNLRFQKANYLKNLDSLAHGFTETSYYLGTEGSFFPLHTEEDMYSASQLLFGEPKIWFVFSAKNLERLIKYTRDLYQLEIGNCSNPLRHKNIWLDLKKVAEFGIPFTRVEQHPGDTIVLDAQAAHCGYNTGGNLAQAINFLALEKDWNLKSFMRRVTPCNCGEENVRFAENLNRFQYRTCKKTHVLQAGNEMPTKKVKTENSVADEVGDAPILSSQRESKRERDLDGQTEDRPSPSNQPNASEFTQVQTATTAYDCYDFSELIRNNQSRMKAESDQADRRNGEDESEETTRQEEEAEGGDGVLNEESVYSSDDAVGRSAKRIKREPDSDDQTREEIATVKHEPGVQSEVTAFDCYDFNDLIRSNQSRLKREKEADGGVSSVSTNLKVVYDVEYRAPE